MFASLSDRLGGVLQKVRGQGRITEDNVKDTLREVRMALLEADVALPVVKQLVDQVREKALGEEVLRSLTPGQALVKIVNDELVRLMGEANEQLDLAAQPPAVLLMAGLQGSGKTTSVAKLARLLQERDKKKVMVVSADVYRPAAIDQLQTLAAEVDAEFFPSSADQKPLAIARSAVAAARKARAELPEKSTGTKMVRIRDCARSGMTSALQSVFLARFLASMPCRLVPDFCPITTRSVLLFFAC